MLTSFPISRKKTLGRSFQNVFGSRNEETVQTQPQQHGLFSVTLPDSINSLDKLSPTLYAWLNHGENSSKGLLRIYSPSGELITDPLPAHLTKRPPPPPPTERHSNLEEQMFSVAPISNAARETLRKQTRKPVPNPFLQPKQKTLKRFFLNIMELEFKGIKADQVVCLASLAGQKRTTSWLPVYPSSKQNHVYAMESFLFDIPQSQADMTISILVYEKQKSLAVSPSVSSLTSTSSMGSFFSLNRRGTISSLGINHHSPDFTSSRKIASPHEIGNFICEMSITIPATTFSKVQSWHSLTSLGRLKLEMGMMLDQEYVKVAEVPRGMSSHCDYINFYLLTPGGLIWDKKYVVGSIDGLFVYSSEYWDSKSAHAWVPFKQLVQVAVAKREFMPCLHTLQVSIALPWKDDTTVFNPTPFSSSWKDMLVEAGETEMFVVKVYLSADSEERMEGWKKFLECHIERNHPK